MIHHHPISQSVNHTRSGGAKVHERAPIPYPAQTRLQAVSLFSDSDIDDDVKRVSYGSGVKWRHGMWLVWGSESSTLRHRPYSAPTDGLDDPSCRSLVVKVCGFLIGLAFVIAWAIVMWSITK